MQDSRVFIPCVGGGTVMRHVYNNDMNLRDNNWGFHQMPQGTDNLNSQI